MDKQARDVAQLVNCLPSMQQNLGLVPNNPSTWVWWNRPVIPALRENEEMNEKFKVIFGYIGTQWPAWDT